MIRFASHEHSFRAIDLSFIFLFLSFEFRSIDPFEFFLKQLGNNFRITIVVRHFQIRSKIRRVNNEIIRTTWTTKTEYFLPWGWINRVFRELLEFVSSILISSSLSLFFSHGFHVISEARTAGILACKGSGDCRTLFYHSLSISLHERT